MNNAQRLIAIFGPVTGIQLPMVFTLLAQLDSEDLRRGLQVLGEAESYGPMLDPTAYRSSGEARLLLEEMVRKLLPAVELCRKRAADERAMGLQPNAQEQR